MKAAYSPVFAMFSAVLMLVGMFPSVPAAVVAAESTGSEGTAVAKKAYVMDAADLKAEQFGADGKVTEDIKVGTPADGVSGSIQTIGTNSVPSGRHGSPNISPIAGYFAAPGSKRG